MNFAHAAGAVRLAAVVGFPLLLGASTEVQVERNWWLERPEPTYVYNDQSRTETQQRTDRPAKSGALWTSPLPVGNSFSYYLVTKPFQVPGAIRFRAEVRSNFTKRLVIAPFPFSDKWNGVLEWDFLGKAKLTKTKAGAYVKLDFVLLLDNDQGWILYEDGTALKVPHDGSHKTRAADSTILALKVEGFSGNEAVTPLREVSVSQEWGRISESDRIALNGGNCPPAMFARFRDAGLFPASAVAKTTPAAATPAAAPVSAFDKLKATYDAEVLKINAARDKNFDAEKELIKAKLFELQDKLTRDTRLEEALAVKKLIENPESDAAVAAAPAETKPILKKLADARSIVDSARDKEEAKLRKLLLVALNGEMKAAASRGDLDSALAFKRVIDAGGSFAPPKPVEAPKPVPVVAPAAGDSGDKVAGVTSGAKSGDSVPASVKPASSGAAKTDSDKDNTLFGRRINDDEKKP